MHTFIDKDGEVVKGFLPEHDQKDYRDKLVEVVGELKYDDSKADLFPFSMNEWEGVTTFRLQPATKK